MPKKPVWKSTPPTDKEAIKSLHEIEDALKDLSRKVFELKNDFEFPFFIAEIKDLLEKKKIKDVTTERIMKRYNIGYGRAAILIDVLKKKKIIK